MRRWNLARLAAAATAGNLLIAGAPAFAQSDQRTFLDLSAGLGYSSNPFLAVGDDQGSGFFRVSAYGEHSWLSERGATSISGFAENSSYFNEHGSELLFNLGANTHQRVSERVQMFGSAAFSVDYGGQLSNRFVSVPTAPQVPDPNLPPPVTVTDPDLFALSGRHYRLAGSGGATFSATEVSSLTFSGGAERAWFDGDDGGNDYTSLFVSGGYDRSLSARTSVGFQVNAHRTSYDESDNSTLVINPALTARTRLSEAWEASGSIGLLLAREDRDGVKDWTTDFSLGASMCRTSETERFCGELSRYAANSAFEDFVVSTSLGVSWYKRFDQNQTLQLSANIMRYSTETASELVDDTNSDHFSLAANYDRRINDRFSVGASVGARALQQAGPNPDMDFSGSVYLRYRLGDLL